jgi:formylglycine-generating enzyme required for sulfatase activity
MGVVLGRTFRSTQQMILACHDWSRSHSFDRDGPAAVGSFPAGASPYGCANMAGNLNEWCADWYDEKAYARYARGDLTPPARETAHVVRGGSWAGAMMLLLPQDYRCADRGFLLGSGGSNTGFRRACDAAR